jgi:uncharacterized protein YjiS (DUF1127 family)
MSQSINITCDTPVEATGELGHVRHRLFTLAKAAYATWRARRNHRRDVAHLQTMSDRMLADIGLTRSEIEYAVWFGRHGG